MKPITIFTPTYNREYILPAAYQSLKEQSSKNFKWLIVDDGSSDSTPDLVKSWQNEGIVDIEYFWKPNAGMHTAHNVALANIKTPLCFCLDSDDHLTSNAIETILKFWEEYAYKEEVVGIAMNETFINSNSIIGTPFPDGISQATFDDIYYKYQVKGDKLLIYKHSIFVEHDYPVFEGERFVPLDYKYLLYPGKLALFNSSVYLKEYLDEGHSKNLRKTYARNPKGYGYYHKFRMSRINNFLPTIKSAIHYTGCMLLSGQKSIVSTSPKKLFTIVTYPLGVLWYLKLKKERSKLGEMHKSLV